MAERVSKTKKELVALLDQIDTEGLLFLKKQAVLLIHNQTVRDMQVEEKKTSSKKGGKTAQKKTPVKKSVDIETDDTGKFFYFIVGSARIFFCLDEMKSLVRVCQKGNKSDAHIRLFSWIKRERGDFIVDTGIRSAEDAGIKKLTKILLDRFAVN